MKTEMHVRTVEGSESNVSVSASVEINEPRSEKRQS